MIDEFEVRLVDKRGRLKCVAGSLAAQVVAGEATQFVVDERHQFFECCLIAFAPVNQELRYAVRSLHICAKNEPKFYNK